MMRVLVTGGAGFIGANFLNLSVRRYPDRQFVNADSLGYAGNLASVASIATRPNYSFERLDITDSERVDSFVRELKPHLVVHFAAESHVDRSLVGPRAFIRTNVEGTLNLLEACRRHWRSNEGLFHHVSTDEVYGSLGESGFFTEETRYDPSSPYSASKAASDHLVRAYFRTFAVPVKITNCSNNYGPYQFPEKLVPLTILNAIERKPLPIYGRGINVRDWLFVDDHVEAIWSVIERGRLGETYNVGGNTERRNVDVVRAICRVVASETGASETDLTSLMTFVGDRPGHDARYAIDASKLRSECSWEPKETFESGLLKTVRWYLANREWIDCVRTGEYRKWIEMNYARRDGDMRAGGHGS
jgi:dTDP-glucose 4,6-dehydratase